MKMHHMHHPHHRHAQAEVEAGQAGASESTESTEMGGPSTGDMGGAVAKMQDARDELADTIGMLEEVKAAIPGTFDEAEANYLVEIEEAGPEIQEVYRSTLNGGFHGMALFVAACAAVGLIVLVPYREKTAKQEKAEPAEEDTA